ncbi:MAG: heavy-metal-associated domain-containing protein [Nitrososphaeria archaeon]
MDKKVKLRVYGMTCEGCAITIENGLKSASGVKDASVSLEGKEGTVLIDDERILPEDLLKLPVFGPKSQYKAQIAGVDG